MKYQKEIRAIRFHEEDRALDTIEIELPSLEEWYSKYIERDVTWYEAITLIDGYGLDPKDQYFQYTELPSKLKDIYQRIYNKYKKERKYKSVVDVGDKEVYEEIENNQIYYKEEIKFIQREWFRRKYGYWCFINGQPTYFNGFYYYFINYWSVDADEKTGSEKPKYREYQKDVAHGFIWADTYGKKLYKHRLYYRIDGKFVQQYFNNKKTLKKTYVELKNRGIASHFEYGWNGYVDAKHRTCNGLNYVTGRRAAKTAMVCAFNTWLVTMNRSANFAIQAFSEDRAKKDIYAKFVLGPFLKLPFFFRPSNKGSDESFQGVKFTYEKDDLLRYRSGMSTPSLESIIKPLPNTYRAADGSRWRCVYIDEPAKKSDEKAGEVDVYSRYTTVIKPSTMIGDVVVGTVIMATTIGEMTNGGGGLEFQKLCKESHYGNRNGNGVTQSGLFNLFVPGYVTAPSFVDKYGRSIIEDSDIPIEREDGTFTNIGARTWLKNTADEYERDKNWESLTKHLQNFPPSWEDAFSIDISNSPVPKEEVKNAISELKMASNKTKKVHFQWVGEKFKSNVVMTDLDSGAWTMSYAPNLNMRNLREDVSHVEGYIRGSREYNKIYAPDPIISNKFFLACDPVKLNRRNAISNKISTPAAAIFYKRDYNVDGEDKPREEWVSNDWVITYNERTDDKTESYEQWLMAAIFYGAYMYPEWPDGEEFVEYVRQRGFDGYLLYDMYSDGKKAQRPGVTANPSNINEMITDVITHLKHNAKYTKHLEVLEQWARFNTPEDLTHLDLAAASGWCFKAMKSLLPQMMEDENMFVEIDTFLDTF